MKSHLLITAVSLSLLGSACVPLGASSDGFTCFYDGDGDGFGVTSTAFASDLPCAEVPMSVDQDGDCDDATDWIHPGAFDEPADGYDADCRGGDPWPCWRDEDGDGYGGSISEPMAYAECELSEEHSPFEGDCDDTDPTVKPGAEELPEDGVDQDCDGAELIRCWWDGDGDGFGAGEPVYMLDVDCAVAEFEPGPAPQGGDCDESAGWESFAGVFVYPGAPEVCDNILNDCALVDELGGDEATLGGYGQESFVFGRGDGLQLYPTGIWGAWTVELELDDAEPVERVLLSHGGADGWILKLGSNWSLRLETAEGVPLLMTGPVPLAQPFHSSLKRQVALAVDGSALRLLSGAEVLAEVARPESLPVMEGIPLVLGAAGEPDPAEFGELHVGDFRVWRRALGPQANARTMCRALSPDRETDVDGLAFVLTHQDVVSSLGSDAPYRAAVVLWDGFGDTGLQVLGAPHHVGPAGSVPVWQTP